MIALAKAFAVMDGRDYVAPHDVARSANCALAHRLVLTGTTATGRRRRGGMRHDGAGPTTLIRPIGFARGASALAIAWLIACAIAVLTGASAVVILLAVGLVAFLASVVGGWSALRHVDVQAVTSADLVDEGDDLSWQVRIAGSPRVHAELRIGTSTVATGWIESGSTALLGSRQSAACTPRWRSAARRPVDSDSCGGGAPRPSTSTRCRWRRSPPRSVPRSFAPPASSPTTPRPARWPAATRSTAFDGGATAMN